MKKDKEKQKLEDQKLATLNILEDMSEMQRALAVANKNLKKEHRFLEALSSMNKELSAVEDLEEGIRILAKHLKKVFDYSVLVGVCLKGESKKTGVITDIRESVEKDFINELEKKAEERARDDVKTKSKIAESLWFVTPLKLNDKTEGAICIGYGKTKALPRKGEKNLIRTMIITMVNSVEKVKNFLKANRSKTQSLVENLNNGVIMFEEKGKITFMNPIANSFLSDVEVGNIVEKVGESFKGSKVKKMIKVFFENWTKGEVEKASTRTKHFEVFIVPVKGYKGETRNGAIILNDITHLSEINKMKTEFVSLASHQLRTPLTTMRWYLEMLLSGDAGEVNKKQKEYLMGSYESCKRMGDLINDLLNMAMLESGRIKIETELLDISDLIKEIIKENISLLEGKRIKLEFKNSAGKIKKIEIDKILFRQMLHNLISNAINYTPNEKESTIKITLSREMKGFITISVRDEGIGIPKEAQKDIFKKFFRAQNAVSLISSGTGLGLYLVKTIADAIGGNVRVESEVGKGTTFHIDIPEEGMMSNKTKVS